MRNPVIGTILAVAAVLVVSPAILAQTAQQSREAGKATQTSLEFGLVQFSSGVNESRRLSSDSPDAAVGSGEIQGNPESCG